MTKDNLERDTIILACRLIIGRNLFESDYPDQDIEEVQWEGALMKEIQESYKDIPPLQKKLDKLKSKVADYSKKQPKYESDMKTQNDNYHKLQQEKEELEKKSIQLDADNEQFQTNQQTLKEYLVKLEEHRSQLQEDLTLHR